MNPDLAALLELQAKHKVVLDLEDAVRALEPELEVLEEELRRAEDESSARRTRVEDADTRREELEGKIETYRVMQERRRQKLEWVRGAKEASMLMAELDLARSVLAREEGEWLRSADKVQELQESAAESEKAAAKILEEQAPKREELAGRRAELGKALEIAIRERDEAAKGVTAELQDQFQRILKGRARLVLYPLSNGACGHCYTAVPLHRQQKIRDGDSIEACEACGVMIYREEG